MQVKRRFIGYPVHWAFSARGGNRQLEGRETEDPRSLGSILQTLADQGYRQAVVQSLHLLPAKEFHQFVLECRKSPIACHPGMPILATPQDYQKLAECLAPIILKRADKAILLVGHGTSHPAWVAYHALETIFRRRFGQRIFVGVVEKFPDSEAIPSEIVEAGFERVCIIPLLVVAGMHYHRDVIGAAPHSWLSRLQELNLDVESIAHGLGLQPGFCDIILDHIEDALRHADPQGLPEMGGG